MDGGAAAEVAILGAVTAVWVAYNSLYFGLWHAWGGGSPLRRAGLWSTAVVSRAEWSDVMMLHDDDAATMTYATHVMRNVIVAATFMTVAIATLDSRLLQMISTAAALQQLDVYAADDPITHGGVSVFSPQLKLGLSLGTTFLALLFFSLTARMAVHLGFVLRVAGHRRRHDAHQHDFLQNEVHAMVERVSIYFSIAVRCFVFFLVLLSWAVLGALALCIATGVLLPIVVLSDYIPQKRVKRPAAAAALGRGGNGVV